MEVVLQRLDSAMRMVIYGAAEEVQKKFFAP
jgi:hypothetical protein